MSLFNHLSEEILADTYFHALFSKAELSAVDIFFQRERVNTLNEKEYIDLLRFADILSRSKKANAQNKAYKVISLLFDDYKSDSHFRLFAESILTKLGNFPAIKFLQDTSTESKRNSIETAFEGFVKEAFQAVPGSNLIFTDPQYQIFERLKNSNHYSFSGPTSLGKSFILNAFIRHLIDDVRCNENIVILVPTRALINQITAKLKKDFSDIRHYKILSHPTVPSSFREERSRFIFVFTPERLVSYLSDINNPRIGYLFIDEAQKVVSEKDSRSPLYYHAILQAERKSIKLYFASPNIPNPEVFLQLFEKSTDEAINVESSPVSQNRYFLDLIDKRCIMFSDNGGDKEIDINFKNRNFFDWLKLLSSNDASIVYCNSKSDTINYALEFSKKLPDKSEKNDKEKIDELISIIKDHLHQDYFLIDCLKKGIAFHFGSLPQRIRQKVEYLFEEKVLDYVFCTSTLLEGVNLPAKNIFILNNAIGLNSFSDIDFWNLAGRAGRLAKELAGNIICMRVEEKRYRWNNPEKDLAVVRNKKVSPVKSLINSGIGKFYKNIEASLLNKPFTNQSASEEKKNIWKHYANITLIHEVRSDDSALRSNFIAKNPEAVSILQKLSKANAVPEKILSSYSMIKAKYQNKIFQEKDLNEIKLTSTLEYETILKKLELLCDLYEWKIEESGGHYPMLRSQGSLKYYAVLMSSWINSKPINWIIASSINYHKKTGKIWIEAERQLVDFIPTSKRHINIIINNTISDIDNILRFKLKNYFGNYHEILVEKLGHEGAGPNWADYLEYGTTDYKVIELQNIGIPRHLSQFLLEKHNTFLTFDSTHLTKIDKEGLLKAMDKKSIEYKELVEVI
jgi:hypothetical protein